MTRWEYYFPTFVALSRWWLRNLTIGGKSLFAGLLFCIPGLIALETPLIQLFSTLAILMLVAGVVNVVYRPRLTAIVRTPASVRCGDRLELVVMLRNDSNRTAFDVSLEMLQGTLGWEILEAAPLLKSIGCGETAKCSIAIRATRRGWFRLPHLKLTSTFPLNLFRSTRTIELDNDVIVTPSYQPLAGAELDESAARQFAGLHVEGVRSGGDWEYFGSREYRPGIRWRRWDYASWARLGRPVVREYFAPRQTSTVILVDTFLAAGDRPWPREQTTPELEAALSLAAAMVDELVSRNFEIGPLILGPEVQEPPTELSLAEQKTMAMERLGLARAWPQTSLADLAHHWDEQVQSDDPTLLAVFCRWNEQREAFCNELRAAGWNVRALIVGDDVDWNPPGRRVPLDAVSTGAVDV